jgi:photoactive yellow protein
MPRSDTNYAALDAAGAYPLMEAMLVDFESIDALEKLEAMGSDELDSLPFGVVVMTKDGRVLQSAYSGLSLERVVGRNFFTEVAPGTNNCLVANRMLHRGQIDEYVPYVFTVRLRQTHVMLRLLSAESSQRMFLLVSWDSPL